MRRKAPDAMSRADYNLHFCRFFAHGKAIDTEEPGDADLR